MPADLRHTIAALDERQTLIGCRLLTLMMDRRMARDPRSGRPTDLVIVNFDQWVRLGGAPVGTLVQAIDGGDTLVIAAIGRRLMQTCRRWGYHDEVRAACRLAYAPVNHLGKLSAVAIVAALAGVMLWHPDRPTIKTLLDNARPQAAPDQPGCRYPWFHRSEPYPPLKQTVTPPCQPHERRENVGSV